MTYDLIKKTLDSTASKIPQKF